MERPKELAANAERALATLEEVLREDLHQPIVRDAAIQRFEHTSETMFRMAQRVLLLRFGKDERFPKSIIRDLFTAGLTNEQETESLLKLVDDRNLSVHAYNEALATGLAGVSRRMDEGRGRFSPGSKRRSRAHFLTHHACARSASSAVTPRLRARVGSNGLPAPRGPTPPGLRDSRFGASARSSRSPRAT